MKNQKLIFSDQEKINELVDRNNLIKVYSKL